MPDAQHIMNFIFLQDFFATDEVKKATLEPRVKHHENRLATLKKGNYLLQANVDRLKDEISKQKEMSLALQAELDSVISELG
jgi:chromosome segregation ATPase